MPENHFSIHIRALSIQELQAMLLFINVMTIKSAALDLKQVLASGSPSAGLAMS